MHTLKRKLYKRGASYEVTIPSAILFGLNLQKKQFVNFELIDNKWHLFLTQKDIQKQNLISRKLYHRGSSYETTLPLPMILTLQKNKNYYVTFEFDQDWIINFEEIKHAK